MFVYIIGAIDVTVYITPMGSYRALHMTQTVVAKFNEIGNLLK